MATGDITLTRSEALDLLAALDVARSAFEHHLPNFLSEILAIEEAAALLVDYLFPDAPNEG